MVDEINYVHEDAPKAKTGEFFGKRWVRITGASLAAAVVVVGAFGAGVVAGQRMGNGNQAFGDNHGFGQQFGGHDQINGGLPGGIQGGFPGGCPANDPDHCAGTDRGKHAFQLPNNGSNGTTSTNGGAAGTSNP